MAGWKRRLQEAATDLLGLPPDALGDVSRVTCLGAEKVVVENATELLHVSETRIEVALTYQDLVLEGREFTVTLVSDREVHIEGAVSCIRYQARGGVIS
ncbi:MAG: hypothetical protein K6T78_02370 [Alicyclobacillus sp.]|nr:hypothetical protein [Alicyclobacillus sp.]